MTVHIGIDVSAKTLDVAYLNRDGRLRYRTFQQTAAGHQQRVIDLRQYRPETIVMEATGTYFLNGAIALTEARLPCAVIHPKATLHFAKARMQRTKTDRTDAQTLAALGRCMPLPLWQPPAPVRLALRDGARRLRVLAKQPAAEKNRLQAYQTQHCSVPEIIEDRLESIECMDQRIQRLTPLALDRIAQDHELQPQFDRLTSATGVGPISGLHRLGELG